MSVARGWQFFMHPGPTNIPHRVLQAMARPAVDFTGPEFVALRERSLERLKAVLKTKQGFAITYAASGNGASTDDGEPTSAEEDVVDAEVVDEPKS